MTDDIVTRLRERIPYAIHPHVLAEAKLLSDAVKEIERLRDEIRKQTCCQDAADEIERLRNALAEQTIIHEVQKTNTLSEIERLRQKEFMWKMTAVKLAGKMLPFSLLMNESEREEIQIVLQEAINDD